MDQPQSVNWQLISEAIAAGTIPAPAGSNENGEPYWIFNEQQITWQQVQTYVLQVKQQQAAASTGSGGGLESGGAFEVTPQPINVEAAVDTSFESNPESQVESAPERTPESRVEQPQLSPVPTATTQPQAVPPQADEKPKKSPVIGQSPALDTVDTSDPQSMLRFSRANKNEPVSSSNKFLAEFLEKVLQVLSLEVK